MSLACVLCQSEKILPVKHRQLIQRRYYHCSNCDVIFADPADMISSSQEKARYEKHQNNIKSEGYRAHLWPVVEIIKKNFKAGAKGLDFGCGPAPALQTLLQAERFVVDIYDPYFSPYKALLQKAFDFVTATEVVEHFRHPREEWKQLLGINAQNFIIMTQLHSGPEAFADWWYARDLTHVVFYGERSWSWLQTHFSREGIGEASFSMQSIGRNLWLIKKTCRQV